ncbi:MAG: carbohydrate-binding domain-containing protein [Bacteroidaceae bacterium]|nr:carbohydrate-binding domain-containing protein [Bacteroidaceae bacterium]
MKKLLLWHARCLFACMLMFAAGCGRPDAEECNDAVHVERAAIPVYGLPSVDETGFGNKVYIEFSEKGATVSELPSGVSKEYDGKSVLLRSRIPGVEYVVRGKAGNASLIIVSEFSPLVTLDGLSLTAHGRNALEVSSEELIFLRAVGDNSVADIAGSDKADNQSAAVKLMGRAVLCGDRLDVDAGRRSALFCTDTLYLSGIALMLDGAPNNALLSNRSIVLSDGALHAGSAKDVVKCKNGDFVMLGGTVMIASSMDKADGVQATNIYMSGGALSVMVSGAAADGLKAKGNLCISGGVVTVEADGGAMFNSKKSDYSSASCLKSDAVVDISGGDCAFHASGDGSKGISCDSMLIVSGGSLWVTTSGSDVVHPVDINAHASSKGIKSDGNIYFLGGDIGVAVLGEGERSEGVESKKDMYIGGDTRLYAYAYDDALNAVNLTVAGGWSYFYSVANDAVDGNGSITINGGTLVADGSFVPEQGIDVDDFSAFTIKGGRLFSIGGSMGPFPALPLNGNSSAPVAVWSGVNAGKGCVVSLSDADGNVLLAYTMPRNVENGAVLVASPDIKKGAEYCFALSAAVDGAIYEDNGIRSGGKACGVTESASFSASGFVDCVANDGKVTVVEPGNAMPMGMMPPPFVGDGAMIDGPLPPPPPMRRIRSEYGMGNLPNRDVR